MTQSFMRYPGGKSRLLPILSPYIDNILIEQKQFADVFVGGGSVLLDVARRFPNIQLFANDADAWVSSLWSVVSGPPTEVQELLERLDQPVTIEAFYKLAGEPASTKDEIGRAYRAIFFNRTCFSGITMRDSETGHVISSPIGGKSQQSKYKVDCRYNAKKLKEKILDCHKLLYGRTEVSEFDFTTFMNIYEGPMYCDPPYWIKAHMLYTEQMSIDNHKTLSSRLHARNNWVLSYDDAPEVRQLYNDKQIIDLAAKYSINGKKSTWQSKNELIILSE